MELRVMQSAEVAARKYDKTSVINLPFLNI
jgi:hypothetical protein